ncbi:MAG: Adenylate cyclase [Candidatus Ozemobacter sibiricus]|jgi:class 3 adenylate cyclase|uniref:Adenylate cyclase n=1 Tax=Candidatus Ozemobacter sibiricus TaxID=2268124 RepID=A0A367ZTJ4_9BACT|nr:MAG: Adenylate cyclase [Candidatus Ozemobacter sibiricus]
MNPPGSPRPLPSVGIHRSLSLVVSILILTFPLGLLLYQQADQEALARELRREQIIEQAGRRLPIEQGAAQTSEQLRRLLQAWSSAAERAAGRPGVSPRRVRAALVRLHQQILHWQMPPHDAWVIEVGSETARVVWAHRGGPGFRDRRLLEPFARWAAGQDDGAASLARRLTRELGAAIALNPFQRQAWQRRPRPLHVPGRRLLLYWDVCGPVPPPVAGPEKPADTPASPARPPRPASTDPEAPASPDRPPPPFPPRQDERRGPAPGLTEPSSPLRSSPGRPRPAPVRWVLVVRLDLARVPPAFGATLLARDWPETDSGIAFLPTRRGGPFVASRFFRARPALFERLRRAARGGRMLPAVSEIDDVLLCLGPDVPEFPYRAVLGTPLDLGGSHRSLGRLLLLTLAGLLWCSGLFLLVERQVFGRGPALSVRWHLVGTFLLVAILPLAGALGPGRRFIADRQRVERRLLAATMSEDLDRLDAGTRLFHARLIRQMRNLAEASATVAAFRALEQTASEGAPTAGPTTGDRDPAIRYLGDLARRMVAGFCDDDLLNTMLLVGPMGFVAQWDKVPVARTTAGPTENVLAILVQDMLPQVSPTLTFRRPSAAAQPDGSGLTLAGQVKEAFLGAVLDTLGPGVFTAYFHYPLGVAELPMEIARLYRISRLLRWDGVIRYALSWVWSDSIVDRPHLQAALLPRGGPPASSSARPADHHLPADRPPGRRPLPPPVAPRDSASPVPAVPTAEPRIEAAPAKPAPPAPRRDPATGPAFTGLFAIDSSRRIATGTLGHESFPDGLEAFPTLISLIKAVQHLRAPLRQFVEAEQRLYEARPGRYASRFLLAGHRSTSHLAVDRATQERSALFLGLIMLLLAILVSVRAAAHFLEPLGALLQGLARIRAGDFQVTLDAERGDEFGALGSAFNLMARKLQEGKLLGRFVSSSVRKAIDDSAFQARARQGMTTEVTVLFSSLTGFEEFEARARPDEIFQRLGLHLEAIDRAVQQHGGEIDKVMGEKILVLFVHETCGGGPGAVAAALAVARDLRAALAEAGLPPPVIGINTGPAVYGIIGAQGVRLDLTAIGDTVNLAARLATLAHTTGGSQVVIGGASLALAGPGVPAQRLPFRHVKGKTQQIEAFLLG